MLMSGGMYGRSSLNLLTFDFDTCNINVQKQKQLNADLFGEGITVVGETAYQLTLKENQILEWHIADDQLNLVGTHDKLANTGLSEGWGLSFNKKDGLLYGSDGSDKLTVFKPHTFDHVR